MAILNKNYASFNVKVIEYKDLVTGDIYEIEIDFSDSGDEIDATKKDDKGNPKKILDLKNLKAKVREKRIKQTKQNKDDRTKALRFTKGQKDGKGGQIMKSDLAEAIRYIAKKEKITLKKAIEKYQNEDIVVPDEQYFGQHEFDDKLDDKSPNQIKNKILLRLKDSSGQTYRFRGTGSEIFNNKQYQKLRTRNLNRVYKSIAPNKKKKS